MAVVTELEGQHKVHALDAMSGVGICEPFREPIDEHASPIYSVAISADGSLIATGSDVLCLWDTESGSVIRRDRGDTFLIFFVAFSSDGSRVVTTLDDGVIHVCESHSQRSPTALKVGQVSSPPHSPTMVLALCPEVQKAWDQWVGFTTSGMLSRGRSFLGDSEPAQPSDH